MTIGWNVRGVASGECLHLEWREHGGLVVTAPERIRFGSRLVERALAMELGKAEIIFRPGGGVCEITASLEGSA